MIEVSSGTAVILYVALGVLTVLAAWSYQHYRRRPKLELAVQQLYICEYCNCIYLGSRLKSINRCPECQSLNKNNPYRKK